MTDHKTWIDLTKTAESIAELASYAIQRLRPIAQHDVKAWRLAVQRATVSMGASLDAIIKSAEEGRAGDSMALTMQLFEECLLHPSLWDWRGWLGFTKKESVNYIELCTNSIPMTDDYEDEDDDDEYTWNEPCNEEDALEPFLRVQSPPVSDDTDGDDGPEVL